MCFRIDFAAIDGEASIHDGETFILSFHIDFAAIDGEASIVVEDTLTLSFHIDFAAIDGEASTFFDCDTIIFCFHIDFAAIDGEASTFFDIETICYCVNIDFAAIDGEARVETEIITSIREVKFAVPLVLTIDGQAVCAIAGVVFIKEDVFIKSVRRSVDSQAGIIGEDEMDIAFDFETVVDGDLTIDDVPCFFSLTAESGHVAGDKDIVGACLPLTILIDIGFGISVLRSNLHVAVWHRQRIGIRDASECGSCRAGGVADESIALGGVAVAERQVHLVAAAVVERTVASDAIGVCGDAADAVGLGGVAHRADSLDGDVFAGSDAEGLLALHRAVVLDVGVGTDVVTVLDVGGQFVVVLATEVRDVAIRKFLAADGFCGDIEAVFDGDGLAIALPSDEAAVVAAVVVLLQQFAVEDASLETDAIFRCAAPAHETAVVAAVAGDDSAALAVGELDAVLAKPHEAAGTVFTCGGDADVADAVVDGYRAEEVGDESACMVVVGGFGVGGVDVAVDGEVAEDGRGAADR